MPAPEELAVCSWSLKPGNCDELIAGLRECGLSRVQLGLDPLVKDGVGWEDTGKKIQAAGITIVSGMVGAVGEDYSSIESIARTGGIVPDATWPATRERMTKAAPVAKALGLPHVTFHAGFIPHDTSDPIFTKALTRVGEVADLFGAHGVKVGLETGQESADGLRHFLETLDRDDVFVNFDPANMLLYGSGDPIAGLRTLMPFVRQVHLKDAQPSGVAGEWGREVPVGEGAVKWDAFFETLRDNNFGGPFVIEREAGPSRVADVRSAVKAVASYL